MSKRRVITRWLTGAALFATIFFLLPHLVSAQAVNVGLTPEVGQAIGLGTTDIRVTAARIIRNLMGLLGIIAVLLILYGGFLWMTSGGDEEKVTKAKQVLTSAVIGLAIVLAAMAIAQFVLRSLEQATGANVGGGGGGGGGVGSSLPAGSFYLQKISPDGAVPIRNVVARAIFSKAVDAATASTNFSVSGPKGAVSGTVLTSGNTVEFTPSAACPPPNADRRCFDAKTTYTVSVGSALLSTGGQPIICGGLAPVCSGSFTTGELVDVAPPTVKIEYPDDGGAVSVDDLAVPVQVHATDDAAVSHVTALADGALFGTAAPDPGVVTKDFLGVVNWDTSGVALGGHALSAQAYDVDTNWKASEKVSVTVLPKHCFNKTKDDDETGVDCGGSCLACGGAACANNGQCASGFCQNGVCVDKPLITAVTPADGAVGNLVTLSGSFFGATPGRVSFLGSGQAVTAALCDSAAWSDGEITVVVPAGAVSGPIEVTAANGQSDATNDARGPLLNNFIVDPAKTRPGICRVTPSSGAAGTNVTLNGQRFGAAQGSGTVFFSLGGKDYAASEVSSWQDKAITLKTPTLALDSAQNTPIRVRQQTDSNQKNFLSQPLGYAVAPRIDLVDPASGPVGEYVTLRGANFGAKPGTVYFRLPDQTTAIGDTSFPAACGTDFWTDTAVTIKVPKAYQDTNKTELKNVAHSIEVRRVADGALSNTKSFSVTVAAPGPGICALLPDNGPPQTTKTNVVGERFGTIAGGVTFTPEVKAAVGAGAWQDQSVIAAVPADSQTGPVRLTAAGGLKPSNGVPFAVGACKNTSQCAAGRTCCADGTCRTDCVGTETAGGYFWRVSTGEIPQLPQVVEETTCVGVTQSPSPYKGSRDACANANVTARFTTAMDSASLLSPGAVQVFSCGQTEQFDSAACDRKQPLSGTIGVSTWNKDGAGAIIFDPTAVLAPNTWYETVIASDLDKKFGARSAAGLYLDGDRDGAEGGEYRWRFRIRADGSVCAVDHVEVQPDAALLYKKDSALDFRAHPTAANCNSLDCQPYVWEWQSRLADNTVPLTPIGPLSPVSGAPACVARATAKQETPVKNPLHQIATVVLDKKDPSQNKSDFGELTIAFKKPEVIAYWPTCSGACTNSGIGATFNTTMDATRLTDASVQFYECDNEACATFTRLLNQLGAGPYTVEPTEQTDEQNVKHAIGLTLAKTGAERLKNGRWYRVIVVGGSSGVRSESGALLSGLNYGNSFSWKFRTRNDAALCDVSSVTLEPPSSAVYIVGDVAGYLAKPWSAADSQCAATPLDWADYDWSWSTQTKSFVSGGSQSSPPTVATLDFGGKKDTLPLWSELGCVPGWCLHSGSPNSIAVCGNGKVEYGEDCDDGNTKDGDGCSAKCLAEGGTGGAVCGNKKVESGTPGSATGARGENCDDGNTKDGDGCSAKCLAEGSTFGGSVCGNGDVGDGETCDDGNSAAGDGCSSQCLREGALVTAPFPQCGNGKVEYGEDCDDGNVKAGDGCSPFCLAEGNPNQCSDPTKPCCGNGLVNVAAGENCDDGNSASGDGCSDVCRKEGSSARYGFSALTASYCGDQGGKSSPQLGRGESCEFKKAGDGRADPSQIARGQFGGTAAITAAVKNAAGNTVSAAGQFALVCACTTDVSCSSFVTGAAVTEVGCGLGSCCYLRPQVAASSPAQGTQSVCRNAAVSARFNTVMDVGTFVANTLLLVPKGNGSCPTNAATPSGWCLAAATPSVLYDVSGATVTDPTYGAVSELRLTLKQALAPNQKYGVLILGDSGLTDDKKEGVLSAAQVGLAGDYFWSFTTGPDICQLNSVAVTPVTWLFSTAQNNPADDPGQPKFDQDPLDNDKQFVARALSTAGNGAPQEIAPIPKVYDWVWDWASSDGQAGDTKKWKSIEYPKQDHAATQVVRTVAAPQNGEVTLTARSEVTADKISPQSTVGSVKSGKADLTVLICENPWPARQSDGSWKPFLESNTNFSFSYCRDDGVAHQTSDDLPAPQNPAGAPVCGKGIGECQNSKVLEDILFPLACDQGACNPGDAFGFRVLKNSDHDSIAKWYALQGFVGSPQPSQVDGYDALVDGRSVYVSAVNKVGDPTLFSNVYLLSSTEQSSERVKKITERILGTWTMNATLGGSGMCAAKVCGGDQNKTCAVDSDCSDKGPCAPRSCTADSECVGAAGGVCDAPKWKLRRDLRRLADFREIEDTLESARASTLHCSATTNQPCLLDSNCPTGEYCAGEYPALPAGSFLRGQSVSRWDSWQKTLAPALKVPSLPTDPLNVFGDCAAGGYDPATCYKTDTQSFLCPLGSHVYNYKKAGTGYSLGADFEYLVCDNQQNKSCRSNSDCGGGNCVAPWSPDGKVQPVSHTGKSEAKNSWQFSNVCVGAVLSGGAAVCGNGKLEVGEECEVGQTQALICQITDEKTQQTKFGYMQASCGGDCKWLAGECKLAFCGDGIVNGGEVCDDGAQNGAWGKCAKDCKGPSLAGHCGDGVLNGAEVCDYGGYCRFQSGVNCQSDADCKKGDPNDWCTGATTVLVQNSTSPWNTCSFDCKSFGAYCGNNQTEPENSEECDGQTQTDTATCPVCGSADKLELQKNCAPGDSGHKQVRTRPCLAQDYKVGPYVWAKACTLWQFWSECQPVGQCGDGVKDAGEECDDGNDNNADGCIIVRDQKGVVDASRSCKKAACGDGFVKSGVETCDEGVNNVNPANKEKVNQKTLQCPYGQTCQFCTTTCAISSVSGGYCGDGKVTPAYEACESNVGNLASQDPTTAAKYPNVDLVCYPNCQSYCPPTFQSSPSLQFNLSALPGVGNYLDKAQFKDGQSWYLVLPACRYMDKVAMNVNFQSQDGSAIPSTLSVAITAVEGGTIPGNNFFQTASSGQVTLPTTFVCLKKEQKFAMTINWGGSGNDPGLVTVTNVTPSYCPLLPYAPCPSFQTWSCTEGTCVCVNKKGLD